MRYAEAFESDGKTPLTGDRLFAARGEHRLHFTDADRASVWKKELPALDWIEVDGCETLDMHSLAWVLAFVELSTTMPSGAVCISPAVAGCLAALAWRLVQGRCPAAPQAARYMAGRRTEQLHQAAGRPRGRA